MLVAIKDPSEESAFLGPSGVDFLADDAQRETKGRNFVDAE